MDITVLKGKIHRMTVTQAELDYVGSITLDEQLMDAAGIVEYEQVHVVNVSNGKRLVTYAIAGKRGSGTVCLNGAAAHCADVGDVIIVMAYAQMDTREAAAHRPQVVFVDASNQPTRVSTYEKHGRLEDMG